MQIRIGWKPTIVYDNFIEDERLSSILNKRFELPRIFATSDVDYLHGLIDAGVDSAKDLLNAIGRYQSIEIFSEFYKPPRIAI